MRLSAELILSEHAKGHIEEITNNGRRRAKSRVEDHNDKVVNSRPRKRKPAPLILHGDAESNRRDLGAKGMDFLPQTWERRRQWSCPRGQPRARGCTISMHGRKRAGISHPSQGLANRICSSCVFPWHCEREHDTQGQKNLREVLFLRVLFRDCAKCNVHIIGLTGTRLPFFTAPWMAPYTSPASHSTGGASR